MTQPYDPNQPPQYGAPTPPPPAYGASPPQQGGGQYGGYGPPPGQRVNDPAPMGMRLLARIIDGILMIAIVAVVAFALGLGDTETGDGSASFSLTGGDYFKVLLIFLAIGGVYEVGMLSSKGATLGKMAVGVRVAMLENGQKPTMQAALIRWVIPAVASVIPTGLVQLVVYLSPFFDSTHRNRGWYDYAANTIAVRTK
jgi:uncharacterized RDD family membrane protein YckC